MAMMMIGIDDGVFFLDKIEDFLEEGFLLGKKKTPKPSFCK